MNSPVPSPVEGSLHVVKGHGTGNDFVVVPDLDGALSLSPQWVRAVCDRHTGIGADGVLRVVRCRDEPEAAQWAGSAEWFMDYRNADGSVAESCGNGIRVFTQYLLGRGLVDPDAAVATRGGIVRVLSRAGGDISVFMGRPRILADRPVVTAAHDLARPALAALTVPNPHVVVTVGAEELDTLDLGTAPGVVPALRHGQNVEFVAALGPRHLRMRVHERGVGETLSCGTGICAAAVAAAGVDGADGSVWTVDVPGGRCTVTWHPDGEVELTGPAVLVADIVLGPQWHPERFGDRASAAAHAG